MHIIWWAPGVYPLLFLSARPLFVVSTMSRRISGNLVFSFSFLFFLFFFNFCYVLFLFCFYLFCLFFYISFLPSKVAFWSKIYLRQEIANETVTMKLLCLVVMYRWTWSLLSIPYSVSLHIHSIASMKIHLRLLIHAELTIPTDLNIKNTSLTVIISLPLAVLAYPTVTDQ